MKIMQTIVVVHPSPATILPFQQICSQNPKEKEEGCQALSDFLKLFFVKVHRKKKQQTPYTFLSC